MVTLVESTKPFKVRASCGHITIRRMREATAGIPYSENVVLEAPNGRPCDECASRAENAATYRNTGWTKRDYECTNVVAAVGLEAPGPNWVQCDPSVLDGLTQLHIERGIRYYGYL